LPFYRRLGESLWRGDRARLIVAAREARSDVEFWLRQNAVKAYQVVHVRDPRALGLTRLPTALILDGERRVTDIVQRAMTTEEEGLFEQRAAGIDDVPTLVRPEPPELIDLTMLETLGAPVLDVRPRALFSKSQGRKAINIPMDELTQRAVNELRTSAPIALDCTNISESVCRATRELLVSMGFVRVLCLVN
jgi:rhodanese-related sulfurtransferase